MSNLGLGVMIGRCGGNEGTVLSLRAVIGKTIDSVEIVDDVLCIKTTDGGVRVSDGGQICCESRYMTTDDDLSDFAGAVINGFELKDAPNIEDSGEEHEIQFFEVATSKGAMTFANHNEHNGYYGGFYIVAKPLV